jgi:hypothetical protein
VVHPDVVEPQQDVGRGGLLRREGAGGGDQRGGEEKRSEAGMHGHESGLETGSDAGGQA